MDDRLQIEEVVRVDGYGLVVYFSDKTFASYTVEELASLRPVREIVKQPPRPQPGSGV